VLLLLLLLLLLLSICASFSVLFPVVVGAIPTLSFRPAKLCCYATLEAVCEDRTS